MNFLKTWKFKPKFLKVVTNSPFPSWSSTIKYRVVNKSFLFPGCGRDGSFANDQCDQRCHCRDNKLKECIRIRKEFTSMTKAERERYVRTILTASTDPKHKKAYDNLICRHHAVFFKGIHDPRYFLPWHRNYLLEYENLMRTIDCRYVIGLTSLNFIHIRRLLWLVE